MQFPYGSLSKSFKDFVVAVAWTSYGKSPVFVNTYVGFWMLLNKRTLPMLKPCIKIVQSFIASLWPKEKQRKIIEQDKWSDWLEIDWISVIPCIGRFWIERSLSVIIETPN